MEVGASYQLKVCRTLRLCNTYCEKVTTKICTINSSKRLLCVAGLQVKISTTKVMTFYLVQYIIVIKDSSSKIFCP